MENQMNTNKTNAKETGEDKHKKIHVHNKQ